jgi:DNA-binding NarL/FixJ family response regulator
MKSNGAGRLRGDNALTPAQKDVLKLIAKGLRTAEIAESLGRAPGTVRTHVHEIFLKLGVHSRIQAARYVWAQERAKDAARASAGARK